MGGFIKVSTYMNNMKIYINVIILKIWLKKTKNFNIKVSKVEEKLNDGLGG